MKARAEDTPPPSPSIGSHHEDDELYEDEVAEEIGLIEGEADVSHDNNDLFSMLISS